MAENEKSIDLSEGNSVLAELMEGDAGENLLNESTPQVGTEEDEGSDSEGEDGDAGEEAGSSSSEDEVEEGGEPEELDSVILIKTGDKTTTVTPDSIFKHKYQGKEIEVTGKELVNNYITSQEIDRKFSKLDLEKKELAKKSQEVERAKKHIDYIDSRIQKIAEDALNGNMMGAAQSIIAMATGGQGESSEVYQKLVAGAKEVASKFDGMSEAEKELYFRQKDAERQIAEAEKKAKTLKEQTEQAELARYVKDLQHKNSVSDEELAESWKSLAEHHEKIKKQKGLGPLDRLPQEKIAEEVISWALAGKTLQRLESTVIKIAPKGSNTTQALQELVRVDAGSLSDTDLEDVVKALFGINDSRDSQPLDVDGNGKGDAKAARNKSANSSLNSREISKNSEDSLSDGEPISVFDMLMSD